MQHNTNIERLAGMGYDRETLKTGAAPAFSAEGQECAQCGCLAWSVDAIPFCLDHSHETMTPFCGEEI